MVGAEGPPAIGDGGAAVSLMPDVDGMYICVFESLRLEGSYVGDLLYNEYVTISHCGTNLYLPMTGMSNFSCNHVSCLGPLKSFCLFKSHVVFLL